MNVLVIAPHPDDESIGCGGTLYQHAARGDRVVAVFLTSGELGLKQLARGNACRIREAEARQAAAILGISAIHFLRLPDWCVSDHIKAAARRLRPILRKEKPAILYLPHPREWHPDHQAALPILRVLYDGNRAGPELRGYEVWTPLADPLRVENITAAMPRKLRALRAHRSQLNEFDYVRAVRGLNQYRGELAGKCRYAEVFEILTVKSG
jgi:N-acetylglucosamine malate deacetylase 1